VTVADAGQGGAWKLNTGGDAAGLITRAALLGGGLLVAEGTGGEGRGVTGDLKTMLQEALYTMRDPLSLMTAEKRAALALAGGAAVG
jgi:hypothetical protein